MQTTKNNYRDLDPDEIGFTAFRRIKMAALSLLVFLSMPSLSTAQAIDLGQNSNGNSSLTAGGTASKISTGTSQSVGQTPLLIIKNNTGVSAVTQGWAVGTQNASTNVVISSRDAQAASATVSIMQNPTGTNVKNNVSALTQPPTIVVSLPTCTGGQTLVGNVCACTGGFIWNGTNCAPPVTCASILPANSSTSQTCIAYYGSAAWSGNVITNTTWSCPSTYASPVSSVANNTSGCIPLTACSTIKPADSSTTQTCNSYYSASSWDGNVITTTTWTCPSTYGTPSSSLTNNTSGCIPKVVTCTAGSVANAPVACSTGYNGGTKFTTKTTTCPLGIYGAPSVTTSGYNTSGCIACPSSFNSAFTPTCPVNTTGVSNSGVKTTNYSCSTGSAVASTTVTNAGTCTANPVTCTPSTYQNTPVACDAGSTGTKFTTTTITCPSGSYGAPNTVTSGYDTSACIPVSPVCQNGATNYPTCTFPPSCQPGDTSWGNSTYLYCSCQGCNDPFALNSTAQAKTECAGNVSTYLETTVFNKTTSVASYGYSCGVGYYNIYTINGVKVTKP